MSCEKCEQETERAVYQGGKRLCIGCGDGGFVPSALAHNRSISKRKYGISMTHAEVMRIRTNKKQSDGQYRPHWRFREV